MCTLFLQCIKSFKLYLRRVYSCFLLLIFFHQNVTCNRYLFLDFSMSSGTKSSTCSVWNWLFEFGFIVVFFRYGLQNILGLSADCDITFIKNITWNYFYGFFICLLFIVSVKRYTSVSSKHLFLKLATFSFPRICNILEMFTSLIQDIFHLKLICNS